MLVRFHLTITYEIVNKLPLLLFNDPNKFKTTNASTDAAINIIHIIHSHNGGPMLLTVVSHSTLVKIILFNLKDFTRIAKRFSYLFRLFWLVLKTKAFASIPFK